MSSGEVVAVVSAIAAVAAVVWAVFIWRRPKSSAVVGREKEDIAATAAQPLRMELERRLATLRRWQTTQKLWWQEWTPSTDLQQHYAPLSPTLSEKERTLLAQVLADLKLHDESAKQWNSGPRSEPPDVEPGSLEERTLQRTIQGLEAALAVLRR